MGPPRLRWRRSAILFAVALLLPCVLLAVLAARMLMQDRELAEKRADDRLRNLAARISAELLPRLDAIKRAEIERRDEMRYAHDATVLVAPLDSAGVLFAWDQDTRAISFRRGLEEPDFATSLRTAERLEFGGAPLDSVLRAFRQAGLAASDTPRRHFIELLTARARARAQPAEARRAWVALSRLGADVRDEQGIPLALYAMRRLADADGSLRVVRDDYRRLIGEIARSRWLSPVACHAAAELDAGETGIDCRQIEAASLAAQARQQWIRDGSASASAPWATDSAAGLLLTADARAVVALDLREVSRSAQDLLLPAGAVLVAGDHAGAVQITGVRGLGLLAVDRPEDSSGLRAFYLATLALVLTIGLVGAYGVWRDTRRDMALAELRSQFVASVTHELKTPLTAIRMFADTLRQRPDAPHAFREEYLSTIAAETERLTRLLNNVLDFSAVERGEREYRLTPHDLRDSVDSALRTMRYAMEQRGFRLDIADRGAPLPIRGDADALEQALLNLLANAVKYSGHGRVISVAFGARADEAFVAIRDCGLGIALKDRERIFEKFYRVRGPDTDAIGGAGLGLTLVRHIMAAHGGRVTVDSALGEGSTFTILIPLAPEVRSDTAHVSAAEARVTELSR